MLQYLPRELQHMVLMNCDYATLSQLSHTSHSMNYLVYYYRQLAMSGLFCSQIRSFISIEIDRFPECSSAMRNHEVVMTNLEAKAVPHFGRGLGVLLQKVQVFAKPSQSFDEFSHFLLKFQCKAGVCALPCHCKTSLLYGNLLHGFLQGLSPDKRKKCFKHVVRQHLFTETKFFLSRLPGFDFEREFHLRIAIQRLLIEPATMAQRRIWFPLFMKDFSYTEQARLLYLVGGPFYQNTKQIAWDDNANGVPMNRAQVHIYYSEIGGYARSLVTSGEFSKLDVIYILREMTQLSGGWLVENCAFLYNTVGQEYFYEHVKMLAKSHRTQAVAELLAALLAVYMKMGQQSCAIYMASVRDFLILQPQPVRAAIMTSLRLEWERSLTDLLVDSDDGAVFAAMNIFNTLITFISDLLKFSLESSTKMLQDVA